jgi:hypothetical protein
MAGSVCNVKDNSDNHNGLGEIGRREAGPSAGGAGPESGAGAGAGPYRWVRIRTDRTRNELCSRGRPLLIHSR